MANLVTFAQKGDLGLVNVRPGEARRKYLGRPGSSLNVKNHQVQSVLIILDHVVQGLNLIPG